MVKLEDLQKYGRVNRKVGLTLSFIQVEFGLDFLKEQWESFFDFSLQSGETYNSFPNMCSDFADALKELTTLVP